jgi:HAD superfamily hydrolase (TIGR01509 family)
VVIRICRTWSEGCARAGVPDRGIGALTAEHDALNADYQRGRIHVDTYTSGVSALLDGVYSPVEVRRVLDAWTIEGYPGIPELVDELHAEGLATAILSNTSHEHWITFDRYAAFRRVPVRLASHELGALKPEPAAYRAVEAATGCGGEEILLVDDLAANVAGAGALGWRAAQIDPAGDTARQVRAAVDAAGAAGSG